MNFKLLIERGSIYYIVVGVIYALSTILLCKQSDRTPLSIGMPTYAGSSVTAEGLLFFAGTQDYYLRAFDAQTDQELWKTRLPVASSLPPMAYISPEDCKEYIAVAVGGSAHSPDVRDYIMAFSLSND